MSYILEALKKSEQERNPEQVPGLDTHHHHVVAQKKSKMPYWFLGIGLLIINMVYIIYQMNQQPAVQQEPTTKVITETQQINKPLVVDSDTNNSESIALESIAKKPKPITETTQQKVIIEEPITEVIVKSQQSAASRTLDRASLPDITALSSNIQKQLPSIDYSTHIYIKEGGSFVVINGRSYGDGMMINQDLKIEKILTDGIVLIFQEQYFFLGSMVSW